MRDTDPQIPYDEKLIESVSNLHWGQRKLLFSEILFFLFQDLTSVANPICIYAGSAPGDHIPILADMFPEITFHCFDNRPFNIRESARIIIHRELLLQDNVQSFVGQNVYLISDIRRDSYADYLIELLQQQKLKTFKTRTGEIVLDESNNSPADQEYYRQSTLKARDFADRDIDEDMRLQESWVHILNVKGALLKFRLPYPRQNQNSPLYKYLFGTIMYQTWSRRASTEMRLMVLRNGKGDYFDADYDITEYESRCFWHNTERRTKRFYENIITNDTTLVDSPNLINDYDSTFETFVLQRYLGTHSDVRLTGAAMNKAVVNLSRYITEQLSAEGMSSRGKTLANERAKFIPKNLTSRRGRYAEARQEKVERLPETYHFSVDNRLVVSEQRR